MVPIAEAFTLPASAILDWDTMASALASNLRTVRPCRNTRARVRVRVISPTQSLQRPSRQCHGSWVVPAAALERR